MAKLNKALAALSIALIASFGGKIAAAEQEKAVKISYIIYTEAGNIFWNPALQGIKDAAKDFNADVAAVCAATCSVKISRREMHGSWH